MTLLKHPSLSEIYAPIESDLKDFSKLLKEELASSDELMKSIHEHLLKMSGKFLRPVLSLLSAGVEGKKNSEVIKLAVAIELIHTATLVHDDIIDNSELRRNQPSIYSKWGREISIVSGDYLYAKAFLLLARLKDSWVNQAFAACAHLMCEGEMKQIERRSDFFMSEGDYLKIIHQKTAALFQAACLGGAYYSGTSKENLEKMGNFGYELGMAFQIVDDCLDLVGDTESLGKTTGLDIYKNDVTLPLLYLFQTLGAGNGISNSFEKIKRLSVETGSVERAMQKARWFAERALENLQGLKDSAHKQSLIHLTAYCVERIR
jgi:octaprenyl-diphosphate synthase